MGQKEFNMIKNSKRNNQEFRAKKQIESALGKDVKSIIDMAGEIINILPDELVECVQQQAAYFKTYYDEMIRSGMDAEIAFKAAVAYQESTLRTGNEYNLEVQKIQMQIDAKKQEKDIQKGSAVNGQLFNVASFRKD